ncbi:MAG: Leucine-rich repeat (LRR) protein [Crocinitomicaceae bacterium]|jgi:Leucine-rich repeat (LRR) protein
MKTLLLVLISVLALYSYAQNVNIPDANFKAYLVGNTAINTNADTEIQVSEATAFGGLIDCGSINVSDLSGIEAFTALTSLVCYGNQLTSLDVTQNTALTNLSCYYNLLTSIDVSQNTALTELDCSANQLTSLDVTQNIALEYLYCGPNQLTSLDVSYNTALTYLFCQSNQLTSVDVTQNAVLTNLNCNNNQLTSLDLSQNTALAYLICGANNLFCLNVANGNNSNFDDWIGIGGSFSALLNPNLNCIEVDDVAYSDTTWTV